ncbi:putative ABC exporter domain-containing protein [Roseiconus lacunae]|uniref:putative ABC exporter domain-containing protein n=1 Tax=Roseiconus lacunae TaxID=2605694 RepID=UPI00308D8E6A|nr:putative ABC exporter domain-containing protein [Stieleria sp. HD01]
MSIALLQLTWLLAKGSVRRVWRMCRTPAGLISMVLVLGCFVAGVAPSLAVYFLQPPEPDAVPGFAKHVGPLLPLLLFVTTAVLIVCEGGKSMLELRPAELQFVLAGPFTSAQILTYRLLTVAISLLPLCVLLTFFMRVYFVSWLGGVIGITFAVGFIIMLGFQYTLLQPRLSPRQISLIRLGLLAALLSVVVEASYRLANVFSAATSLSELGAESIVAGITKSNTAIIVGFPFVPFAKTISAPADVSLATNAALSLAILGLITACCYRTSAGFAELAVEGVARRIKKLERLRDGNTYQSQRGRSGSVRYGIPTFPFLSGIGPIVWLEITIALRRNGRFLIPCLLLGAIAALVGGITVRSRPDWMNSTVQYYAPSIAFAIASYVGGLIAIASALGLAKPPRTLDWYRTLPVGPTAIAIGAMSGTAAAVSCLFVAIQLPAIAISTQPLSDSLSTLVLGVAFAILLGTMINFVTAVSGLRATPTGTPDILQGARSLFYMLLFAISLIPPILFALASAAFAGVLFEIRPMSFALGGSIGLLVGLPAIWWYTGQRFRDRESIGTE